VVGFAKQAPSVYVALMHSGVTLAPLIGELAAIEIASGAKMDVLEPYRLERFQ
jgi:glycine/D-amino acid oxidase-like deaminating enzyme